MGVFEDVQAEVEIHMVQDSAMGSLLQKTEELSTTLTESTVAIVAQDLRRKRGGKERRHLEDALEESRRAFALSSGEQSSGRRPRKP